MTSHFNTRFKLAIERNFDQSAGIYDSFEEKHGLFENLTIRMVELIAPAAPRRILDAGCGSGISTLALYKALSYSPTLYGIDLSEAMLTRARERCKGIPGVYFVQGDAERLSDYFHETFDAVFFTASIFLIPGFRDAIHQACRLIVPKGVLGISFYSGLYDSAGRDAIESAFPDLKYRYGAVPYRDLLECVNRQKQFRTVEVDYHFEITLEFLFDFLSIPAQSAGLFPKIPYIERIPLVRDLCARLIEKVSPVNMGWKFLISRKR